MIVRPLEREDLPGVVAIRQHSFTQAQHAYPDAMADYYARVFLENPWVNDRVRPLVAQRADGAIRGFLGVIPRPFTYGGAPVVASALAQFMVHPEERGKGVGRALMSEWLGGAQDFAFSDVANDATRAMMLRAGALMPQLHNLFWTAPVRPLVAAAARLTLRNRPARAIRRAMRPALSFADALLTSGTSGSLTTGDATGSDVITVVAALDSVQLRPVYTEASLAWLRERLAERTGHGTLQFAVARDAEDEAVGTFAYFAQPNGTGQVVHVAARSGAELPVLDALLAHARARGVVQLSGRLEPSMLDAMCQRRFAFHRTNPYTLVHARDAALVAHLASGDCLLSRLDGEWWLWA